jgi:hypothetical protein
MSSAVDDSKQTLRLSASFRKCAHVFRSVFRNVAKPLFRSRGFTSTDQHASAPAGSNSFQIERRHSQASLRVRMGEQPCQLSVGMQFSSGSFDHPQRHNSQLLSPEQGAHRTM